MIRVQGVSKQFRVYASPADRLKEKILRRTCHHEYTALSDISFEVGPGETLGIIGENGAGKSTLLKILSGVLIPDSGTVEVSGKVTGLLELGTGFNPELSGIENIFMNGTFLGMSHDEIEAKKSTIIDFAELGEYIHEPIKTYSSGMMMRLGFAIAIHADPECFLVDEALSVGDAYFQQKCMRKIQEFKEQGGSIIFVSHDMNAILSLTDHAIWLENGFLKMYDEPRIVIDGYNSKMFDKLNSYSTINNIIIPESIESPVKGETSRSTGHVICKNVSIQNLNGNEISQVLSNDTVRIILDYYAYSDIINPDYGIQIRNENGISAYGVNFIGKRIKESLHSANSLKRIIYTVRMNLSAGDYFLTLGVANDIQIPENCQFDTYLLHIWDVKKITVLFNKEFDYYYGITNLDCCIEVQDV